ncbi:hypothetical protein AAFN90_19910, partial [Erwiniaceae bacterium CAU 1747]
MKSMIFINSWATDQKFHRSEASVTRRQDSRQLSSIMHQLNPALQAAFLRKRFLPAQRLKSLKRKKAILTDGLLLNLMPGSSLLSH